MRIVHISAEFAPIAKAGGMGEVLVGLCREFSRAENTVEVILPKYDLIDLSKLTDLKLETPDFKCLNFTNAMWSARYEECALKLLEARHPAGYFHRGKIYACEDDTARFLYFSRAALEYLALKNEPIDILASPTFLPEQISRDYDSLWTEQRVKKVVDAAVGNHVALEINSRYRLPGTAFIRAAKAAGCKFSFGTNNEGAADLKRSEYGLQMLMECKLDWQNFFVPGIWAPRAADRKGSLLS